MHEQQQLEGTIATLIQINEASRAENEAQRSELNKLMIDHRTLAESTRVMMDDRDSLKRKVLELEAANKRLTDMLWGRRSERRRDASPSPLLNFGDDAMGLAEDAGVPSSSEVISAQQAAQVAYDKAARSWALSTLRAASPPR